MPELIPGANGGVPLSAYMLLSAALFCIGVTGVLLRRNMIILFLSIELMLSATNLLFTSISAYRGDPDGQVFVFFIMVVAAAEIAVGLAILVMMYRNIKTVDIDKLRNLKG